MISLCRWCLRWSTSLRRNIREPPQASWNSCPISLLQCSPPWTTGSLGLTFLSPTVRKTSGPVRVITLTPCTYVGSPTGRPTATLQRGECCISILMRELRQELNLSRWFLQPSGEDSGSGWRNRARDGGHPAGVWSGFFWVLRWGVRLPAQEPALDHPPWGDQQEERPEVGSFIVGTVYILVYTKSVRKEGSSIKVAYVGFLWCRKECIFTIDPATARDLDDALSCKQLPDGKLSKRLVSNDRRENLGVNARCFKHR